MTSKPFMACTTAALFLSLASLAAAQAPQGAPPKPGPEHEQLKYFVGKWTTAGEMKESPFMPAGKFTANDTCELFNGGYFVVCHTTGKNPMGAMSGIGILGYDPMKKQFTYYGIGNQMPTADVSEGKKDGENWVYTATMDDGSGKKVQGRYTMSNLTPTSYNSKFEIAPEGSNDWKLVMEAKSTKAEGAKKPS
jgi:Protein of unknown function (DUF1579)